MRRYGWVLGTCRTSHTAPDLLSVRVNESRAEAGRPDNKKIAYLIDLQTVRITDLAGRRGFKPVSASMD